MMDRVNPHLVEGLAWTSLAVNGALAAVKLTTGLWAGSRALMADGVNNLLDLVAGCAVLAAIRIARRPADAEHRYGHRRAETVAALFVAGLMLVAAVEVAMGAVRALWQPAGLAAPAPLALWVAAGAAAVKGGLALLKERVGRQSVSDALTAAAADDLADVLATLAVIFGIAGARLGAPWLDPVAGLAVAALILRGAWRVARDGAHLLMDGFDLSELEGIRRRVTPVPGVRRVRDVRARRSGPAVHVDVVITVDRELSVVDGHAIAQRVEDDLARHLGHAEVMVHVEPDRPR